MNNNQIQELLNRKPSRWGNLSIKTFEQDIKLLQNEVKLLQDKLEYTTWLYEEEKEWGNDLVEIIARCRELVNKEENKALIKEIDRVLLPMSV